jgi:hypothetical protein
MLLHRLTGSTLQLHTLVVLCLKPGNGLAGFSAPTAWLGMGKPNYQSDAERTSGQSHARGLCP